MKSNNIIVHIENGIVTLTGSVENYYEKFLAEKVIKSVRGVKGVVEELQVKLGESLQRAGFNGHGWPGDCKKYPFHVHRRTIKHGPRYFTFNILVEEVQKRAIARIS